MTQQDEERELLIEKVAYLINYYAATPLMGANKILDAVNEAGYVKLAEDQSLPDIENYCQSIQEVTGYSGRMSGYRIGQQDMLEQGWRKVVQSDII